MKILNRIIITKWLKSFLGSFLVLLLLISVGDILNGILQGKSLDSVLIAFVLKLPDFLGKILPICCLLSSVFTINNLRSSSELMAILASGYSPRLISLLFCFSSITVGVLQFLNLGFLQPMANEIKREQFQKSIKYESRYIARSMAGSESYLWYKTDQFFVSFSTFDTKNLVLKNVSIYLFNKLFKLTEVVNTHTLKYTKGNWVALSPEIILNLNKVSKPEVLQKETHTLNIQLSPEDFEQFKSDITTLNIFKFVTFLKSIIKSDINSTEYKVMLYEKLSLCIMCILFALFPIISLKKPNRRSASVGKSIILILLFSIGYWLSFSSMLSLAYSNKLMPELAMSIIPIVFSFLIVTSLIKLRKLS